MGANLLAPPVPPRPTGDLGQLDIGGLAYEPAITRSAAGAPHFGGAKNIVVGASLRTPSDAPRAAGGSPNGPWTTMFGWSLARHADVQLASAVNA